jgi:hypothetical protein
MDLVKWNAGAAVVHGIAAIVTACINTKNSQVQMYRHAYDDTQTPLSKVDIPAKLETSSKQNLKIVVVLFFAITCIAHVLYATDFLGRGYYTQAIRGTGWNPYRWVEYSLSAGFMIYLISAISGTKDSISAVSAALITPSLMINGFTTEKELQQNALHDWSLGKGERPEHDSAIIWSNFGPAWALFFVQWYIILSNYVKLAKEAKDAGQPIEGGVKFMVTSQLFFFSLFGVIQSYQVYRWYTSNLGRVEPSFIIYEKSYIILSAITKLALAVSVFSSFL